MKNYLNIKPAIFNPRINNSSTGSAMTFLINHDRNTDGVDHDTRGINFKPMADHATAI